jgi:hypothetical protein
VRWLVTAVVGAWLWIAPATTHAQQSPQVPQQVPTPQSSEWEKLPRMQLERQYAGPLQDTVIQRWRDPVDGTVCYIYLPITAAHSAPLASGYVQYGANTIGSMSCIGPIPPAATPRANGTAPKGR